jgi:DNA-nicking Smr family endonuclease
MSRDKKTRPAKEAREQAGQEAAPAVTHNPFVAAKAKLQALVKPQPGPGKPQQGPKDNPGRGPAAPAGPAGPAAKAQTGPSAPAPKEAPEQKLTMTQEEMDQALFLREMGGVKRLGGVRRAPAEKAPVAPRPRPSEEAEVVAELADLVEGNGPWDIADTDEYIEGIGPGLDRRLLARLRKGEYAVQGHVDLHGLTAEEARIRVDGFLQEARLRGWRCVLIVHGRGLNSKDQIPVLKERVRVWLTRGRLARQVLCFATARQVDGGAGAVYVLLRK